MSAVLLPPELEREIFEIAAEVSPKDIPTLLCVSRRILAWIEPLLYRTLRLHTHSGRMLYLDAVQSKPADFLADAVRFVTLTDPESRRLEQTCRVLKLCTGVRRAVLYHTLDDLAPELSAALVSLPLQRLGTYFCSDGRSDSPAPDREYGWVPQLLHLTHLDVFDSHNDPKVVATLCAQLPRLPALTHLALNSDVADATIAQLLERCAKLEMLAILCDTPETRRTRWKEDRSRSLPHDARIVIQISLQLGETLSPAPNFWTLGQAFIDRKRRLNLPADCFFDDADEKSA